jgi:hypothetical protein
VNGWGLGNVSTGVQLWHATTTQDPTVRGTVLHPFAYQRVMKDQSGTPITNGLYDNAPRYDAASGQWVEVCAETNAPSNWTNYGADLFHGPDTDHMTRVAQDTSVQAEGLNWAKAADWFVTSGGTGGPWYWDSNLNRLGTLAYNLNLTGTGASFSGFGSHFPIVPLDSGSNTQFLALMFDDSTIGGGNATKGAVDVMLATPTPTGTVFGLPEAQGYTVTPPTPAGGQVGTVSEPFVVAVPAGTTLHSPVHVTPSLSGAGGPVGSPVLLQGDNASGSFLVAPTGSAGMRTVSVTNDGGLVNPAPSAYFAFSVAAAGIGYVAVNHNTGGTDNLRYLYGSNPIGDGTIIAYLASDYTAGNTSNPQGQSTTGADGRWLSPIILQSGYTYTLAFSKQGVFETSTTSVTV